MSTQQRNDAAIVGVDPSTADVLRQQTLVTLEANHYYFEEILAFGPEAQLALAQRYRDAFAVLDAIGWRRPDEPPACVDAPITPGHAEQLFKRRYELGHANIDRLANRDALSDPALRAEIDADRLAAITLDDLIARVVAALRGGEERESGLAECWAFGVWLGLCGVAGVGGRVSGAGQAAAGSVIGSRRRPQGASAVLVESSAVPLLRL
jgi:hypothetical protein